MAEVLAEHGATPEKIIASLVDPGYADRIDACKLLTQLYGVLKATTVFGWSAASAQWACPMKRRG